MAEEPGQYELLWQQARDPSGEFAALVDMAGFGDGFWSVSLAICKYLDVTGLSWQLLLGVSIEIINSMAYMVYYSFWLKRPKTF
jgi:hypothetical protein